MTGNRKHAIMFAWSLKYISDPCEFQLWYCKQLGLSFIGFCFSLLFGFCFCFFFFFQHGVILSRLLTSFGDNFRTVRLCLSKNICVVCRYSRNEYIRAIRQVTCNVSVLILLLIPTVSNGTHYYNDHYKPPTFTS